MQWGHRPRLPKKLSTRKLIMFWHSRQITQLSTIRWNNGLNKLLHRIFILLMSVMNNALKKGIIARKFVKSGRFQLLPLVIFTSLDYGQDFRVLLWLSGYVIFGIKPPVKFSFI